MNRLKIISSSVCLGLGLALAQANGSTAIATDVPPTTTASTGQQTNLGAYANRKFAKTCLRLVIQQLEMERGFEIPESARANFFSDDTRMAGRAQRDTFHTLATRFGSEAEAIVRIARLKATKELAATILKFTENGIRPTSSDANRLIDSVTARAGTSDPAPALKEVAQKENSRINNFTADLTQFLRDGTQSNTEAINQFFANPHNSRSSLEQLLEHLNRELS